jgi:rod shape-determining protein MreC
MQKVNYRVFFVLIFTSLALFLADRNKLFYWPRFGIQTIVNPVEYGLYSSRVQALELVSFLGFWRSGEERIKNLEQKNWELTSKLVLMKSVLSENEALRTQLGVEKVAIGRKILSAPVLGVTRAMEIGAGQSDGIHVGMTVTFAGNLIGKIDTALPHSSFVMLPTDGNSKIPVAIGSVHAVAVGSFGSQILLQKVGQTDLIQKDDLVVTSGEGDSYFPGLVVGRISKITGRETDLFRQAEVVPLLDLNRLTTVFVITDK